MLSELLISALGAFKMANQLKELHTPYPTWLNVLHFFEKGNLKAALMPKIPEPRKNGNHKAPLMPKIPEP